MTSPAKPDADKAPTLGGIVDDMGRWVRSIKNLLGAYLFTIVVLAILVWRALGNGQPGKIAGAVAVLGILGILAIVGAMVFKKPEDLLQERLTDEVLAMLQIMEAIAGGGLEAELERRIRAKPGLGAAAEGSPDTAAEEITHGDKS